MKPRQDLHQAITKELRALVPDATAIIFFGSRVQGLASPTSDYDIMVLTPTGVDLEERERIKRLKAKLTGSLKELDGAISNNASCRKCRCCL